jgi:hypothetical protein
MVVGSGSGGAGEACGADGELQVVGSGSGSSGDAFDEKCFGGASTMVVGSGSGNSGERCGAQTLVVGSGSGSSGESTEFNVPARIWGIAEVVVERSGAHVVVHKNQESHLEEFLVAFLPGSSSEVAHSLSGGSSNHGFVAAP